jgi:hypothetical protein
MNGHTSLRDRRPASHNLEEIVIVNHILYLDSRGFSSRQANVEDMANYLRKTRRANLSGSSRRIASYNAVWS